MNDHTFDHKQLLAELSDDERITLTAKSDAIGLLGLASHLLGMLATGTWIFSGVVGWQLGMLLHGIQIIFLFTLLHETVHDTPFQSLLLNRLVGWACALLILLPPTWFRYFHLAHHRHTHNPEKDPELLGSKEQTLGQYLWTITGIPVWWFHIRTIFVNAFGPFGYAYLPKSAHGRVRKEALFMIGIYASLTVCCYYFSNSEIVYLWVVPAILGQPFLRLYLMAEHGRCPHVANMLENSRTTFTNAIVRWLAWNMPYHAEHHACPLVPFHKLADFHEITQKHLQVTEAGYVNFQLKTVGPLISKRPKVDIPDRH